MAAKIFYVVWDTVTDRAVTQPNILRRMKKICENLNANTKNQGRYFLKKVDD